MSVIRIALICILISLWLASSSQAAENEYTRDGGYLGLGGFFALETSSGRFSPSSDSGGVTIMMGYRMIPALAFEVEGSYLHGLDDNSLGGGRAPMGSIVANLKIYMAESFNRALLGGRLQPYLIGSFGISIADLTTGTAVTSSLGGGGGAEYYLTENWALNSYIQYKNGASQLNGYDYVSFMFGANYRW